MARHCTVCARDDAAAVDGALRSTRSSRSIALGLGISGDALNRHRRNHLGLVAVPRWIVARLEPYPEALAALTGPIGTGESHGN